MGSDTCFCQVQAVGTVRYLSHVSLFECVMLWVQCQTVNTILHLLNIICELRCLPHTMYVLSIKNSMEINIFYDRES